MAITATVSNNGLRGKLYLTLIQIEERKFEGSGITRFLLRGFASREELYKSINNEIDYNPVAHEEWFDVALSDCAYNRESIYKWLKMNKYNDAVDVFE